MSDLKEFIETLNWSEVETIRSILSHEQEGICPICKKKIKTPCLDHQHKKRIKGSGLIRGVICSTCNVFLGKIENNCTRYSISLEELPQILRNIAEYLDKEHLPYLHPSEVEKPKKLKKSSYNALMKIVGSHQFPSYPKSGKLTKPLKQLYEDFEVEPEFYA
jgi:hypothetical protein